MSIKYIPIRAAEYRNVLKRIHLRGCSLTDLAQGIKKTEDWLSDQLFNPDTSERLALEDQQWLSGVEICVRVNPDYTLEELAVVLNETVERLKPYRETA